MSNFGYCSLIWMFCGKTANEEINRVHERAFRRLYKDFSWRTVGQIKPNNGPFTKSPKIAPGGFQVQPTNRSCIHVGIFERNQSNYNLHSKDLLQIPRLQTIGYRANSITYRDSYLWNYMPDVVKGCNYYAALFSPLGLIDVCTPATTCEYRSDRVRLTCLLKNKC